MSVRFRLPTLAGIVALALTLTACGGGGGDTAGTQGQSGDTSRVAGKVNAATTEAAALRAELTALLREDVNLTAYTSQTAVASGFDSEATRAAIEVLHHSGRTLTQTIAAVSGRGDSEHGPNEIQRFQREWSDYTEYFVAYIEGAVASDESVKTEALRNLHEVEEKLAEVIADLTQEIVSVAEAHGLLGEHTGLVTTMIDTIAEKDPAAPKEILLAAEAAQGRAGEITRGLVMVPNQRVGGAEGAGGERTGGDPISEGATLRADLTGYLVQHIEQTLTMAHLVSVAGPNSARTKTAIETMHTNMEHLAGEIRAVYGEKAAGEFTELYEAHLEALVDHAESAATQTSAATTTPAPSDFAKKFADLANRLTDGNLSQHRFEKAVSDQLHTVEAAIETVAKPSTAAAAEVEEAQGKALEPARLLSSAIVGQFPKEFTG